MNSFKNFIYFAKLNQIIVIIVNFINKFKNRNNVIKNIIIIYVVNDRYHLKYC